MKPRSRGDKVGAWVLGVFLAAVSAGIAWLLIRAVADGDLWVF